MNIWKEVGKNCLPIPFQMNVDVIFSIYAVIFI